MKSLPTQERAVKKRTALLSAATLEFSSVGFELATAKSIAARAGVATGTFYHYFANKNEILRVIAENRFVDLHKQVSSMQTTSAQQVQHSGEITKLLLGVLTFLYDYHKADSALHQVLDQRRLLDSTLNNTIVRGEDLIHALVLDFVVSLNVSNAKVVAENLFAMGEGLVHRMVFHSPPNNPQRNLEMGATMLASFLVNQ